MCVVECNEISKRQFPHDGIPSKVCHAKEKRKKASCLPAHSENVEPNASTHPMFFFHHSLRKMCLQEGTANLYQCIIPGVL